MSNLVQRSDIAYKLNNGQPIDLSLTFGSTGSGKAKLFQRRIIVDLVAALHSNDVTITTPIAFEILDVYVIQESSTATAVQVKNTAAAISDNITVTTDKNLYYAGEIDNAASIFARGDDDLVLTISTAAATVKVIITIEPVVKP